MLISALSIYSYFKRAPGKCPKSFSRQGSAQFCTDSGNPVSVVSEVEQDPPYNHYGEAGDQHPGKKLRKKMAKRLTPRSYAEMKSQMEETWHTEPASTKWK